MKVLGIDPGYEKVGVAIVEKNKLGKESVLFSTCLKTKKTSPHSQRIAEIGIGIGKIIEEYKPDILAIEKLFFNTNQKTALLVSEARGVILYESVLKKLEVYEFSPLEIKVSLTGDGRADKKQVMKMVSLISGVSQLKKEDDEFDALAVAFTCLANKKMADLERYPQ